MKRKKNLLKEKNLCHMKIAKKRVKKVLKEASSENEREIFGKTEKKEKTLKTEEDLNEIEELSKIKRI